MILLGYLLIYIFQGLGNILNTYINNKVFIPFGIKLRITLLKNTFFMRYNELKKYNSGDLKNRLDSDVDKLQGFITSQCINYIYLIISSLILIIIMLFQNWILALFSFSMVPLSYFTRRVLNNKIAQLSEQYRKEWGDYETLLHNSFQIWKDIRTNNLQNNEYLRFKHQWKNLNSLFLKNQIFQFINRTLQTFQKMFLIRMNLYFLGGILVINDYMSIGTLLSFMIYYEWFYGNVNDLNNLSLVLKTDMPFIDRVLELLNIKTNSEDSGNLIKYSNTAEYIHFGNVSFTYGDTDFSIKDVNIDIDRGQYVAIIGRSGSGKTTLSNLLLNLYQVNSGEIWISGSPAEKYKPQSYYKMISAVSQEPIMFNLTIRENLLLVKSDATDDEIYEACKNAGLYDLIISLPQGLDTVIGERGVKLSGGEKQRLAIVRVILLNPDIIIFDEATSSLDFENERKITDAILHLAKNKTIIVIAHRLSSLLQAEKVILMDHGEVVGIGTHSELRRNNQIYNSIFERQYQDNEAVKS
jgi:ATP-binding cassette subfamily B protein/subfamily B ATP-binding cassette protein MsbA